MTIKLTDAAKYFQEEQHQIEAWDWLESQVDPNVLNAFANKYRNKKQDDLNNWDGILTTAKKAGAKFPECVAAQWRLESAGGRHTSGKNNFFGLKGPGTSATTQEFINGKWVTIKDGFLDFPDIETCVHYLVDRWYKNFGRYEGVNRANSRNECAELLYKEGYATDPAYASKLIQIMDGKLGTIGRADDPNPYNNDFKPNSPLDFKVTPNITYGELILQQKERKFKQQHQCDTAKQLCLFLEKVRSAFGNKPIIITSGSRPEPINTQVGGAPGSEHTYSEPSKGAIDFYIQGADTHAVQSWCDAHWPYSLGYGASKGFVHVGIRSSKIRVRWNY